MFNRLDHIAIVVKNTEDALSFYRDQLGFPVVVDEVIEDAAVRLTHLDLGNIQLQLVQPVSDEHPLQEFLRQKGEGLHHLCLHVHDVSATIEALPGIGVEAMDKPPHSGPNGRSAAFMNPNSTRGVIWEITSDPAESR